MLVGAGAIIFAILVGMAFLNATQPAYACTALFDPTPAPSFAVPSVSQSAVPGASGATPAPVATAPMPGYVERDMGKNHVATGTRVTYANCPPASGRHYSERGSGPLTPGVYGADAQTIPQGWVHNLEHGGIVMLYNCGPSGEAAACTADGQAALEALYAKWPLSPICKLPPGTNDTPVIARFDDMPYPYAAIVWDVVLPMDRLDESALFDFYTRRGEVTNPEPRCAPATPTPNPIPTAAPTTTPAAAPTTAPTVSPSIAPAPTGSAAPTAAAS